jgi:hypothetical protein
MASRTGKVDEKTTQAACSSCVRETNHDVLFETKLGDEEMEL